MRSLGCREYGFAALLPSNTLHEPRSTSATDMSKQCETVRTMDQQQPENTSLTRPLFQRRSSKNPARWLERHPASCPNGNPWTEPGSFRNGWNTDNSFGHRIWTCAICDATIHADPHTPLLYETD